MKNEYQKVFTQFLTEVKKIGDAGKAHYELSDEILNTVNLSGEIVGNDTHEQIRSIGKKYGLIVMACELCILYRNV